MLGISPRRRHVPPGARVIKRFPFVQEPASTTLVNAERLPEDLKGAELGYRAQTLSDEEAQRYARRYILRGIIFVPSLLYLVVILPLFLPYSFLFVIAGSVLVTLARVLLLGERSPDVIKRTLYFPVAAAATGEAVRWLLAMELGLLVLFSISIGASLVLALSLYFSREGPLSFMWSWFIAHPSIPATKSRSYENKGAFLGLAALRSDGLTGRARLRASLAPLFTAALFLIVAFLVFRFAVYARHNASSAWLVGNEHTINWGTLGPFLVFWLITLLALLRYLRFGAEFGHYLTYDGASTRAPGVWQPRTSLRERRKLLTLFVLTLSLASFGIDGFLLPAGKGRPYFSRFEELRKADLAVETADRMTAPSAPAEIPRVRNPMENEIPPDAASSLENFEKFLRANPRRFQEGAPAKLKDAVYNEGSPDVFDWISDRVGASVAAIKNRVSSFLWLMGMSFLSITPLLCLLLLPIFVYRNYLWVETFTRTLFDPRTDWEKFVERVRSSSFEASDPVSGGKIREADHLFLGIEPNANFPVLLHQKLLGEHAYIVGDSGSGKTSLGIMPIVRQLMTDRSGAGVKDASPLLILDLKGDNALFHMTRELAEKRGQKFLFFTPESDKDRKRGSHSFNPFQDFDRKSRSLSAFSTLFLDALSLNHGEGYGRGYYTARNRLQLFSIIEKHDPKSFQDLYKHLGKLDRRAREDAFELVAVMQMLDSYKQLNPGPELPQDRVIQMRRLVEENEVAYFWLPAAIESISVREIGKLALFSLISATISRQREGEETKQVYVIVDEFQRLAGENFSILLEQARSFGISLILANQTISDLNTPSKDLRPSIRTNTRTKFFFSVTEPEELESLSSLSGQEIVETRSRSVARGRAGIFASSTETEATSESLSPRMSAMDIQRISDHPNEFLLLVSRGSGFTQFGGLPVPVRTMWPMSESEYKRLSRLPWPQMPETETEQKREGLSVEAITVKERERSYLAEAEEAKAAIAASIAGYAEVRFLGDAPEDQ